MENCQECHRLQRLLEEAAIQYYEAAKGVLALDDADPVKVWEDLAARGAKETMDERQKQFNEHQAKHARHGELTATG
jgi:glutaredoxin